MTERIGLVVAVCPDQSVFMRMTARADERGLPTKGVCAAGTSAAVATLSGGSPDSALRPWLERVIRLESLDDGSGALQRVEPLLRECLNCLSKVPSGGAAWQGAWRGDPLAGARKAMEAGAILVAVAPKSIEELRDWAKVLLKSGCAYVQTHDAALAETV